MQISFLNLYIDHYKMVSNIFKMQNYLIIVNDFMIFYKLNLIKILFLSKLIQQV